MRRAIRKPKPEQAKAPSKPHLPLTIHESIAELEGRTRRLLKGCRNLAPNGHRLSFNVGKATEILRTSAADAFDKQVEYYSSVDLFQQHWLKEIADQVLTTTLDLIDPLDLIWQSVPTIEVEVRRTLAEALGNWKRNPHPKQAGDQQEADGRPALARRHAALSDRSDGTPLKGNTEGAMESDTESARLKSAYGRLEAALSPDQLAQLQASLGEIGKILKQSDTYQKNLLRRLGVLTNLEDREEFWLQLWAAARYAGFSNKEFWELTPRELCAVLELKAKELELHPTIGRDETTLPTLSGSTQRELALRWENALEERDLTGKHFHWHDRVRDGSGRIVFQTNTDPLRQIGVRQSVVVAELRLNGLAGAYFDIWDRSGDQYQVFQGWLPTISGIVLRDAAIIWKGREVALDEWYAKVCERAIKAELTKLSGRWTTKARNRELLKLEHAKLKLRSHPMRVSPLLRPTDSATRSESDSVAPKALSEAHPTQAESPAKVAVQETAVSEGPLPDSKSGPVGSRPVRLEAEEPSLQEEALPARGDPVCADRRALLLRFKTLGRNTGIRITDEMVAHEANPKWNDRTMVTWWKRNDPRIKQPHDKLIRSVCARNPSTIWPIKT